MASRSIGLGVVGAGRMGAILARAIVRKVPEARLVGIADRDLTAARRLADELGVSERTVYRDIRDLVASGVPIAGEAGVGYALPRGFELPPLMFTREELEAVVLGMRMVQAWGYRPVGPA